MAQSNPGVDSIRGLSFSLVFSFGLRGFSPGTLFFTSPQKPTFRNSNSTGNQLDEEPVSGFPLPINRGTPLIRLPMGQKNLAVLTGRPYYRGRLEFYDLRAVLTNALCIAFAFLEQLFSLINNQNVDIEYRN